PVLVPAQADDPKPRGTQATAGCSTRAPSDSASGVRRCRAIPSAARAPSTEIEAAVTSAGSYPDSVADGVASDPWASKTTVTAATPAAWPICWTVFTTPAARPSSSGGAALSPAADGAGSAIEIPTPASTNGATKPP